MTLLRDKSYCSPLKICILKYPAILLDCSSFIHHIYNVFCSNFCSLGCETKQIK